MKTELACIGTKNDPTCNRPKCKCGLCHCTRCQFHRAAAWLVLLLSNKQK